ncbi:MAG: hypothetical protein RL598_868 [Verrucomicrobiota bacterium]|jgi:hypothetical protein
MGEQAVAGKLSTYVILTPRVALGPWRAPAVVGSARERRVNFLRSGEWA